MFHLMLALLPLAMAVGFAFFVTAAITGIASFVAKKTRARQGAPAQAGGDGLPSASVTEGVFGGVTRAPEATSQVATAGQRSRIWEAYRPYIKAFIEGEEWPSASTDASAAKVLRKIEKSGSFSWVTLLIGPLYWGYRRLYKEAAIYLACLLALIPLRLLGFGVVTLAATVAAAFLFYPLYRRRAFRAYRDAYSAHSDSCTDMLEALHEAGGPSWLGFWTVAACALAGGSLAVWAAVEMIGIPA